MATRQIASYGNNQPEGVHVGDNVLLIRISVSVTVSPTDTWLIGKLPTGAIPIDAIFYGGNATGAGTFVAKFGTSASPEAFFTSLTYSTAQYRPAATVLLGTRAQISISDDAMPRYENVVMVASAGATLGYLGDLIVYYKMPGQTY